ncbi:hypothetical protein EJB05_45926, partial [Eragrostis curvula]
MSCATAQRRVAPKPPTARPSAPPTAELKARPLSAVTTGEAVTTTLLAHSPPASKPNRAREFSAGNGARPPRQAASLPPWISSAPAIPRRGLLKKLFVSGVPGFAACLSLLGVTMLIMEKFNGNNVENYELLFKFSQFITWVSVSLVCANGPWFEILCNPIMCFSWILKILLEIPHLQYKLTLPKAMASVIEIVSFSTASIFGLFAIVVAVLGRSRNESSDNENAERDTMDLAYKDHNLWELLTFKIVNPMMNIGIRRQLDFTDLLELPAELRPASCYEKLVSSWEAEHQNHNDNSSLLRAMFGAYGWTYLRLGLLKVINDSISFISPLLLNKFIKFLQQGSDGMDGYVLAICLGLTSLVKSFLDSQYSFRLAKLKLMLRSSIMGLVYRKCLCLSLAERSRFSEGEIQTFMSVDADRTINLCNSLHDAWSLPLQIGVALYLLYMQVNYAFLSGLAITIILIPVNKWISTRIAGATEKMMKQKDGRISCAGELLAHIRTVKMYSWEKLFTERLVERRESEVKHLATRKYLDAWCVYFWATTPTLFSLFTFSIFAIMGHPLDAATVFTCVALFNTLISPLNSFPWVINGMIDAVISSRRLSKYLSTPEHCSSELAASGDRLKCDFETHTESVHDPMTLVLQNVGSGKSSLLNSIIGETHVVSGSISSCGSVSYVPQVPWILSGSLRDNILLGKEFDPMRYEEVIQACALDVDISAMDRGDMSQIGEKGSNLSGGQRARLALARALYHNSEVYMFDDVLSAVDSQVASWILEKAIMGPTMKSKTRIISTHNLQAISAADVIVVMANGLVNWFGTLDSYLATPYSRISKTDSSSATSSAVSEEDKTASGLCGFQTDISLDDDSMVASEEQKDQRQGKKAGAFLMQASRNGNDLWLTHWVDTSTGTNNTRFYLIVLAMFGIINSLFTLGRAFSFAFGGLRAAVHIHASLLENIISAPVCFFDQNPSGRILNRLSSDLYTIDDSLPFILNIFVANFFSLLGTLVVLSYSQVSFLLILLPLWLIYSKVQFYYRSTSREVRRLDSVARSPIYSSFTETLDGSSTIRAFRKQDFFLERFIQHVTLYQKTSYSELIAGLWLSLRLQLLAGFIILFIAVMATVGFQRNSLANFGTPGLVGLALSYAAPVVSLLNGFLTTFTETEKEMISVERVVEYVGIPQEELQGLESPPRSWPTQGTIEFEHVTLRYKPELPSALSDVSFVIASGMQVGIIGRTGAGKSSILNALFRLAPICNGRILVDGIDVSRVAVRELRGHFAVVPQSPFMFDGSLRENLDPFNTTTDTRIWEVLEKCHMKGEIESIGGLDIHVKGSGASFSVGQRQLLCLARAILKSSKVEEGNPEVLMNDKFSRFARFAKASNM